MFSNQSIMLLASNELHVPKCKTSSTFLEICLCHLCKTILVGELVFLPMHTITNTNIVFNIVYNFMLCKYSCLKQHGCIQPNRSYLARGTAKKDMFNSLRLRDHAT